MPQEYILETIPIVSRTPYSGISLFDDFSNGLLWTASTGAGTDHKLQLTQIPRVSGRYALLTQTRITTPADNDYVYASRHCPLLSLGTLTFHAIFLPPDLSDIKTIRYRLTIRSAGRLHRAQIAYDAQNSKWQYFDSNGDPQDIPDADQILYNNYWTAIIFGVDLNTYKYTFLSSGERTWDLSSYDIRDEAPSTFHYITIDLALYAHETNTPQLIHDLVLLKQQP